MAYRVLSMLFAAAAVLLSDVMCAVTGYQWCLLEWEESRGTTSFPSSAAVLAALPFLPGILICAAAAVWLGWKARAGKLRPKSFMPCVWKRNNVPIGVKQSAPAPRR